MWRDSQELKRKTETGADITNIFSKVFGTRSEHEVKRIMPLVEKTEALRPEMQKLTDEQLRDKTREFRKRLDEEQHWMIFFRRLLRLYVKVPNEFLVWNITVYRSSVVSFFIRAVSQR